MNVAIHPLVNVQDNPFPAQDSCLKTLFEAAVDAIVVLDGTGRITSFSEAAEKLFGYRADEVLGQDAGVLMPEPHAAKHASYVARYLQTGEKHVIGSGREVQARRKDGSLFPAYLSVGRGESPGGVFFVGILHDLSREKSALRSVQQLAAIVNSTGDAVLGMTLDGIVTYWNKGASELYGYTAQEAIGRPIDELVIPEERKSEQRAINESIRAGTGVTRVETLRRDKSGKRLVVSLTISPIIDSQGKVTGASAIARDITARRMAEKAQAVARRAAEEADRVRADFLGIVSHELRTPLTVILGNISLLTDLGNMPAPAEAAEIARDIEESANSLLALINDLLDISDMEAGQARLRLAPVMADELVSEVVLTAETLASAKNIEVRSFAEPLELVADPQRLKQALTNLVDNAVKFTSEGVVTIGVSRTGSHALFEVSDTGVGIADEELARIFDAFHQGDTSFTRTSQGTGLGLTIVKRIVELHGGVLNVESEPGKGSSFYIALPLGSSDTDFATDAEP